jgi:adhesin transport system membrane fusion protein
MKDRDLKFVSPVIAAWKQFGAFKYHAFTWIVLLFMSIFVIWASIARLDEITQCEGKFVSSGRVQVVDNLEGGLLQEVFVKEGEVVEQGQILARISNPSAEAELVDIESKYYSRLAASARLMAEVQDKEELVMPDEVLRYKPESAADELHLFQVRRQLQKSQEQILQDQITQKQHELQELREKYKQTTQIHTIIQKELKITQPLMQEKLIPIIDYLRQQKEDQDVRGQLRALESALPRVEASLLETHERLAEAQGRRRAEAMNELRNVQAEMDGLHKTMLARQDRMVRTELRSPVKGTVKLVKSNTVGSVIKPGDNFIEVVPLDDRLQVEALVRPSDIAFIRVGMPAKLKISAYDFSIYGSLDAEVETISADTFVDQQNNSFYKVKLKIFQNHLEYHGKKLPIIPGMMVVSDIVTGQKTVMQYMLKPLMKAKASALRER